MGWLKPYETGARTPCIKAKAVVPMQELRDA
jgi:hypothetical protein